MQHLGVGENGSYLPHNRGFQHYYGVPYGVDMCSLDNIGAACLAPNVSCAAAPFVGGSANFPGRDKDVPCPYLVNTSILEQPTQLLTLDEKYVAATRAFIMAHKVLADASDASDASDAADAADATAATASVLNSVAVTATTTGPSEQQHMHNNNNATRRVFNTAGHNPFFIYFCSHHTHVPVFASANFTNTSDRGWFGDHLRMLDWSVGEVVRAVNDAGLEVLLPLCTSFVV
jgi:hypothetical protein